MLDLSDDEMTEGSLSRALVVLAAPIVAMQLVHVVNGIVDTFWLGRLGEQEVAAVGLNIPIIGLLGAVMVFAAAGTQILVAQRAGADELSEARRIAFTGVVLTFVFAVAVAAVVVPNAESLMTLIGADPALAGLAGVYLATIVVFYPIAFASDTVEYAYTAVGDSKMGLYVNALTVAINVVLDPFLIFGWGPFPALGVQGAALASGIGMTAGAVLALVYVSGYRESFVLTRDSLRFDAGHAREILDVGAPLGGQRVVSQVVRVAVIGLVTVAGGAAGVAAYTVGHRLAGLAIVPCSGLQQSAQSIIGQNLGADQPERARRTTTVGVVIAGLLLTAIGLLQWFFPETIVRLLVPDLTPAGRELTVFYLKVLAIGYPAMGATYLVLAGFNGASRTRTSFVVDLLKYWGVRFPIAVLAVPAAATWSLFGLELSPGIGWGVEAIFWAVTISNVVAFVGVGAYFVYTTRDGMFARAADRATSSTAGD